MHHQNIAFQDSVFNHGSQALCQELAKVLVGGKIAGSGIETCSEILEGQDGDDLAGERIYMRMDICDWLSGEITS